MIEGQFDVVFRGQIVKSFELDTVKSNLVALFKSSPEAIERLFSGNEVAIRKGLDYTAAMKYQSALRKAGALALIKEVEGTKANTEAVTDAPSQAVSASKPAIEAAAQATDSPQRTQTTAETPTAETAASDAGADMTLAEAGAQIMPDKVYEKRDVDTSALSLAQAGERIMPKKAPEAHPQPSIDHLKLADD